MYPKFLFISTVAGKMSVMLPSDLTTVYKANVKLEYTGIYRYGHKTDLSITYDPRIDSGNGNQIGLSGNNTTTNQLVVYYISEYTFNSIKGTYSSHNPADRGTFEMSMYYT
jgi:hypothetical protein